jgi:hypothetical protein
MSELVLPIRDTYVSHWGLWEGLREAVSNGLDEQDQHGSTLSVTHDGTWLKITNDGASMDRRVLLLGFSGKTDESGPVRENLRGQYGEGLNLSMLAIVRAGYEMAIRTQTETWKPYIKYSAQYSNERVLCVGITKRKSVKPFVEVAIKMEADEWEALKVRFLPLQPPADVVKCANGTVILDKSYCGQMFVKGIWVMNHHEARGFGFDFNRVSLDRDRRMIDAFDLESSMSYMLREAMEKFPEQFRPKVYDLVDAGATEVRSLRWQATGGTNTVAALVEEFKTRHGEDALPVRTMAESRTLEYFGKKGIVVPGPLADILEKNIGTFATIQAELKKKPSTVYGWHDLGDDEKAIITWAEETLTGIGIELQAWKIVDFADPGLRGLANLGSGEIQFARCILTDKVGFLRTAIHEHAHVKTGASDGDREHTQCIENTWAALVAVLTTPKE